ncbi:adaptive-response sensory kinase [Gloeomargarita lithophora Alchichica-D10]|uniref:histidine kinase n=1 Tax=Gloeomargarita lithophora Alchichica-D10 TaxID=1188229 RepID=A0A1J0AAS2_9CYAN|nr:histidine kinase [Gloeomargarita lithophora]APB33001.1 adaptive-response sensory kinase [Gloeomargarita lithophora Alchichica-D10]
MLMVQVYLFTSKAANRDQMRQLQERLQALGCAASAVQLVDVSEQPYLAERFRVVVTPALVKTQPEPRQVLVGSDLLEQLEYWWPRWQAAENGQTADSTPSLASLEEELTRAKLTIQQLTAQVEFRDQVLELLAHDLRNPLTAVGIALETLELTPDRPDLAPQLLYQARNQVKTLDRLIASLLQVSRNQQNALRINPQAVPLPEVIQLVVQSFQAQLTSRDHRLHLDLPAPCPPVFADPDALRRVLTNLLDNACKYTPPGGQISISTLHSTNLKIQVTVADNGSGIAPADQERIFDPSTRLENRQNQAGYGLGLAVCRQIVQAHYGRIWVESESGRGSTFHFTLPVYRP